VLNKSNRPFLNNARATSLGMLTLVLALVLAACGDSTATSTVAPVSTTAAAAAATSAAASTTAAGATTTAAAAGTTTSATGATTAAGAAPTPTILISRDPGTLNGAGSTFINPLMSKWTKEYNTLFPQVKINYQSIGSGGGRQQFIAKTVDFGASDAPMTDDQLTQAGGADKVIHVPLTQGAVVLAYNLPNVPNGLKFSADTVAGIYLGTIKKWNDPKITADNAGVNLPDLAIATVHRSDGSGTTDIFTDYLSTVNADWKSKVGRGTSVQWPGGIGGQGNEGVANQVRNTRGAVGYVELAYAKQNKISYGVVKNKSGNFIEATPDAVTAAVNAYADKIPEDLRYSIVDSPDPKAYPIAGTTWLLVYKTQADANKGKLVTQFLDWAIKDGQKFGTDLDYAALPAGLVTKIEAKLKTITCGGATCLS
jgi:phosphate transport system substrate-binding protein